MRFKKFRPPTNDRELGKLFALKQYLYWLDDSRDFIVRVRKDLSSFDVQEILGLKPGPFDVLKRLCTDYFIPFNELTWAILSDYLLRRKESLDEKVRISMKRGYEIDPVFSSSTYRDFLPRITIDLYGKITRKEFNAIWDKIQGEKPLYGSPGDDGVPYVGMEKIFVADSMRFNSTLGERIDDLLQTHIMKLEGSTYEQIITKLDSDRRWTVETLRKDYRRFLDILSALNEGR